MPDGLPHTSAELAADKKNTISHRAQATTALLNALQSRPQPPHGTE
ncbi:MAG: non-canonical purine NTP pyrophosphatase [Pseudomonadota bacterium]